MKRKIASNTLIAVIAILLAAFTYPAVKRATCGHDAQTTQENSQ